MSNQSAQNDTSKLWKNKAFLTWFIVLSFIGLVGYGLFFWSAGQNEHLAREVNSQNQRIDQLEDHVQTMGQLIKTDGNVMLKGQYQAALESYRGLSEQMPDSLRAVVQLRIAQIEDLLRDRTNSEDQDAKELMLNRYRKDISILEKKTDSLQSAIVSQSAALNSEITSLKGDIAKKEKAIERQENVEVISFQSTNDAQVHYLGEVENGKANGGGIGIWSTGSIYRGDWKDNRRHGQGTFEWADGEIYEGTFIDGRREGQGKYYWPSGERYEGNWVNNRRNGQGTLFDMDGNVRYKGKWKDDKPVEK